IPAGHTFLELQLVSVEGKAAAEKLLTQAGNRCPDAFDMYIYNDFFAYGVLDLVDKTLSSLQSKIKKKEWEEAYTTLEGFIIFLGFESVWAQCDDGDRVDVTNKTIGASAIAVLRGLDKENKLDAAHFPSLEALLKNLVTLSEEMDGSSYGLLCKAIARRIFSDKSEEELNLEISQMEEWVDGLDDEEKEEASAELKALKKKREAPEFKPWYNKGKVCDEKTKNPDFTLSRVWKEYKDYISGAPSLPMRGPAKWDISKWTAAERRPFEFDAMD
ncbi:hypothetical protein M413DRAFT_36146, partial [Hebeloma cylindrosporum]